MWGEYLPDSKTAYYTDPDAVLHISARQNVYNIFLIRSLRPYAQGGGDLGNKVYAAREVTWGDRIRIGSNVRIEVDCVLGDDSQIGRETMVGKGICIQSYTQLPEKLYLESEDEDEGE